MPPITGPAFAGLAVVFGPGGLARGQSGMVTAVETLRSCRAGVLLADERVMPMPFVIDPRGRVVAPVDHECLGAESHVLFVPEESADALQLLLTPESLGSDPAIADRWRAYHGTSPLPLWAAFVVESGRLGGEVLGGDALTLVNPVSAIEPALCRRANADMGALRAAVRRVAGVDVAEPRCVGADGHGLDVRARFGIVRLAFGTAAQNAEAAAAAVDGLLSARDHRGP